MHRYSYPLYSQSAPYPVVTDEMIRQNEKRKLRSKSNGLGFLILTYFSTMQIIAVAMVMLLGVFGVLINNNSTAEYFLDIAASVFASLVPGLIYLAASGYKLRDSFKKTYVRPILLISLVLMGMGVAMVANLLTEIFIHNISIFGLENHAGNIEIDIKKPIQFILSIIAVSLVPAFAEEFIFRGIVLGLLKQYGKAFSIVCTAIMFGAMHSNTTQMVFAFLLGLVLAFADIVADSILPSVIIHFLNNFFAILSDSLVKQQVLDASITYIFYYGLTILFCLAGFLAFVYLIKTKKDFFRLTDRETPAQPHADRLTLQDKYQAFFINPGMIISMSIFLLITIFNFFWL